MEIDELVDRVLNKHKNVEEENNESVEEQDKKTIKTNEPFRYITDAEEIKQVLESEKPVFTVMDVSETKSIYEIEQEVFQLALGDLDTIEIIIKKHENIRKNRLE